MSPRLAECELTHLDRVHVDVAAAAAQHGAYERALVEAGLELIRLADLPDHPDAVFVEDTALLLDGHAVITLTQGGDVRLVGVDGTARDLVEAAAQRSDLPAPAAAYSPSP